MREFTTIADLRAGLAVERANQRPVGLVPTMGSLHPGHLSLVDAARRDCDLVVMSLFVNPLQFSPGEDFDRYPRDLERDRALAAAHGVDVLFAPAAGEMYPAGRDVRVTGGPVAARWEGVARPGHFDGVLTVVAKLFNLVNPDVACFGQKDIQQVTLIRQMIRQLDFPVRLSIAPTVREPDGLALSSRNQYLSPRERVSALALSRALAAVDATWRAGESDANALQAIMKQALDAEPGLAPDYIAIAEPEGLAPVAVAAPGTVVALAARVGRTRLIDNIILGAPHVPFAE